MVCPSRGTSLSLASYANLHAGKRIPGHGLTHIALLAIPPIPNFMGESKVTGTFRQPYPESIRSRVFLDLANERRRRCRSADDNAPELLKL